MTPQPDNALQQFEAPKQTESTETKRVNDLIKPVDRIEPLLLAVPAREKSL